MVSVFKSGGMLLATSRPSCKAMSAPATLGSWTVRWTISLGVQVFLFGSLKSSHRFVGAFLGAGAIAGAAGTAADGDGAAGSTAGAATAPTAGSAAAGGCGCGLPVALNKSGMLSA